MSHDFQNPCFNQGISSISPIGLAKASLSSASTKQNNITKLNLLPNKRRPFISSSRLPKLPQARLLDKSFEDLGNYVPNWLLNRLDFTTLYKKLKSKVTLDISEICSRCSSMRTEDEKEAVFIWVSSIKYFSQMPRALLRDVCDRLTLVKIEKGRVFINKGEEGDCMYIIYKGIAGIYLGGVRVAQRSEKEVIGETALDSDKPRTADVLAEEHLMLLKFTKIDYTSIILTLKKLEKHESIKFLKQHKFFSKWSLPRMQLLCDYLITSTFQHKAAIYEADCESKCIYIIQSGSVLLQKSIKITKSNKWPKGKNDWEVQKSTKRFLCNLRKLNPGDIFGIETINDKPRATRAVAEGLTTLFVLNKNECFELFSQNDRGRLLEYEQVVPDKIELMRMVKKRAVSQTKRVRGMQENVIQDALQINVKDWGGRETEVDKKLRRTSRYMSSLRLSLKKSLII